MIRVPHSLFWSIQIIYKGYLGYGIFTLVYLGYGILVYSICIDNRCRICCLISHSHGRCPGIPFGCCLGPCRKYGAGTLVPEMFRDIRHPD